MDNQFSSPNIPNPSERPGGFSPEDLQISGQLAGQEGAPKQGGGAPPPTTTPQAKLTRADVVAAVAATPTPGAVPTIGAMPTTAADVDLIEPEWVDKAEEVVRAHMGDPYNEEAAIEVLQEDYLQKRYGITVADPNASDTKPKGA